MKRLSEALDRVAVKITSAVGTMYCAIVFCIIAILATPGLFPQALTSVAQWLAQAFLQLVLLSVIMVGQRLTGARTEVVIQETHDIVVQELSELKDTHGLVVQELAALKALLPFIPSETP